MYSNPPIPNKQVGETSEAEQELQQQQQVHVAAEVVEPCQAERSIRDPLRTKTASAAQPTGDRCIRWTAPGIVANGVIICVGVSGVMVLGRDER